MKKTSLLRRAICVLLVCILTAGSLTLAASAEQYSDIKGHWAEEYLLDLISRGYMHGYTDGTIRPDADISAAETLILLSNMYTEDLFPLDMDTDYGRTATTVATAAGKSWAAEGIAIALGTGIVTPAELAKLDLGAPIDKETLAIFMARAMQLADEAEALISVPLTFTDVYDISPENRCYVYILVRAGAFTGNSDGSFGPKSAITRCRAAAVLSRGLEYIEKNGGLEPIAPPEKIDTLTGIVTGYSGGTVYFMDTDGVTRLYPAAAGFVIREGLTETTWKNSYENCRASVMVAQSTGAATELRIDTSVAYEYGTVISTRSQSNYRSVTYRTATSVESVRLASSVPVIVDGAVASLSAVDENDFVLFTMDGETITSATFCSPAEISGTITSVSYGDSAVFTVTSGKDVYYFEAAASNPPVVKLGNQKLDLARLKAGDNVTVTLAGGIPTEINITGTPESVSGRISKITSESTGATVNYTLTVELSSGVTKLYELNSSTPVYTTNNVSIGVSGLAVGDTIDITVYSDKVVEITKTGAAQNSFSNVSGTVVGYNSSTRELTINVDGLGWVYVDVASARCLVLTTGRTSSISEMTAGTQVVAYGSATDAYHFTATVVYIV